MSLSTSEGELGMAGRVSKLGVYSGFDDPVADGYERESLLVPMGDGCRIAVEVLHPARGGRRLEGEFPTVLNATPYPSVVEGAFDGPGEGFAFRRPQDPPLRTR
jgi:predicted acyl esterase